MPRLAVPVISVRGGLSPPSVAPCLAHIKEVEMAVRTLDRQGRLSRPQGLSMEEAVLKIEAESGKQFDPEVIDALLRGLENRKNNPPSPT